MPTSAKVTKMKTDRRSFLGTVAAGLTVPSISKIQSFVHDDRLHVLVTVDSLLSKESWARLRADLKSLFPTGSKIVVVDPSINIHIADQHVQFLHFEQNAFPRQIFDATGRELKRVRWCHLPTGIAAVLDDDLNEVCVRFPAPLTWRRLPDSLTWKSV